MNSESRNQNPQEKAQAYVDRKHEDGPESAGQRSAAPEENPSKSSRRRTPEQWHDLVSQRIEEAMRNGAFENLPGTGKPLDIRPEPFVPTDMQMANLLLKNNDLVPAWISDRRLLLGAIDQFRTRLVDTLVNSAGLLPGLPTNSAARNGAFVRVPVRCGRRWPHKHSAHVPHRLCQRRCPE